MYQIVLICSLIFISGRNLFQKLIMGLSVHYSNFVMARSAKKTNPSKTTTKIKFHIHSIQFQHSHSVTIKSHVYFQQPFGLSMQSFTICRQASTILFIDQWFAFYSHDIHSTGSKMFTVKIEKADNIDSHLKTFQQNLLQRHLSPKVIGRPHQRLHGQDQELWIMLETWTRRPSLPHRSWQENESPFQFNHSQILRTNLSCD